MGFNRIIQRVFVGITLVLLCSAEAPPRQRTLEMDPAQSKVHFTVDSTFHTVHGTFQVKSGSIQFDPAGGPASGELVVIASSGSRPTR